MFIDSINVFDRSLSSVYMLQLCFLLKLICIIYFILDNIASAVARIADRTFVSSIQVQTGHRQFSSIDNH